MSLIGQKRNVIIAGRTFPGVIVSEPQESRIEVVSRDPRRQGAKVSLPVFRADIITLRTTNPDNGPVREYRTLTSENLRFSPPRFDTVVGLDVTADGELLDYEALVAMVTEELAAFQTARLETLAEPEIELA